MSVVNAIAGKAGRLILWLSLIISSAAICWQSAALPPFPQRSSLLPFLNAVTIRSATDKMSEEHSERIFNFVSELSLSESAINFFLSKYLDYFRESLPAGRQVKQT